MHLLLLYPPHLSSGQLVMKDSDLMDDIPTSIEVGLLGQLRKLITLMPDSQVKKVVGSVLQHESLIAIAHNQSIIVRTAVVRVRG